MVNYFFLLFLQYKISIVTKKPAKKKKKYNTKNLISLCERAQTVNNVILNGIHSILKSNKVKQKQKKKMSGN